MGGGFRLGRRKLTCVRSIPLAASGVICFAATRATRGLTARGGRSPFGSRRPASNHHRNRPPRGDFRRRCRAEFVRDRSDQTILVRHGGVRRGVRDGGAAGARRPPSGRREPRRSVRRRLRRLRRHRPCLRPQLLARLHSEASVPSRRGAAFARLAATATPPPPPLALVTLGVGFAAGFLAGRGFLGQPFGLVGFDFRFGLDVERLFLVVRARRSAAGRRQPAPPAAPWPPPAYAPVRRGR